MPLQRLPILNKAWTSEPPAEQINDEAGKTEDTSRLTARPPPSRLGSKREPNPRCGTREMRLRIEAQLPKSRLYR